MSDAGLARVGVIAGDGTTVAAGCTPPAVPEAKIDTTDPHSRLVANY